jgi:hypothetical protein
MQMKLQCDKHGCRELLCGCLTLALEEKQRNLVRAENNFALNLTLDIDLTHLLFAIHYLRTIRKISVKKITAKRVEKFLIEQIGQFGTREESLIGESMLGEIENLDNGTLTKYHGRLMEIGLYI